MPASIDDCKNIQILSDLFDIYSEVFSMISSAAFLCASSQRFASQFLGNILNNKIIKSHAGTILLAKMEWMCRWSSVRLVVFT